MVVLMYFFLLIASAIFHIAYKDNLSLIFLMMFITVPVVMYLLLIWARLLIKAELHAKKTVVSKGEDIPFEIRITNKSPIPIILAHFELSYHSGFIKTPAIASICAPIHSRNCEIISGSFVCEYAGLVIIELKKIRLLDFLRLTHISFSPKARAEVSVMPQVAGLSAVISPNVATAIEADIFSKTKSGDDPTEVFGIREYTGGDKQNRIHWKLSAKQEELLVKEYSLPVNTSALLLLEFSVRERADYLGTIDALIEITFSLAQLFREQGLPYTIARQSGNAYCEDAIAGEDDLSTAIARLFRDMPQKQGCLALKACIANTGEKFSHIIYITATLTQNAIEEIDSSPLASRTTVIELCSGKMDKEAVEMVGSVQLYRVAAGAIDVLDLQI